MQSNFTIQCTNEHELCQKLCSLNLNPFIVQQHQNSKTRQQCLSKCQTQNKIDQNQKILPIKFIFDKDLANNQKATISKDATNIKHQTDSCNTLTLISPSVSSAPNTKLIIKLISSNTNYISIGLARKRRLIKSKFDWNVDYQGVYMICSNGHAYNHGNIEQHQKSLDFRFGKGNVLELEYLQSLKSLKIVNLNSGKSAFLENIYNQGKDLHYCVETCHRSNEWEIVQEK